MAELNRRQQDILMQIHAEGEVGVDALATRFGVTTQQIRRDLAALCDQGMADAHAWWGAPSGIGGKHRI